MKTSLYQWLKQFSILVYLKRSVWNLAWFVFERALHGRDLGITHELPLFAPYTSGTQKARAAQTILAANQVFPFMVHLLKETGKNRLIEIAQAESFCTDELSKECATILKEYFDKYGSDKATDHNYQYIYAPILKNFDSVSAVLEIGLGSNNEDVLSNMGRTGMPGASLRAFRDFLPRAEIYGADIDKRILFKEDRIRTFFVDQTDLASLDELGLNVGGDFDLIIDDGLHSPNANIAVLAFALRRLKFGGWLVVEDISPSAVPVWQVTAALLPAEYKPHLISAKGGFVFSVERNCPTAQL